MTHSHEQMIAIVNAFVDLVHEATAEEEFAEIKRLNATPEYADCCATHNFFDANMLMADAFERVMGREIELGEETESSRDDHALWNAAWNQAKLGWLTAYDKAALAAEYVDLIGYDPFEDDPAIAVEEVAQILREYKAEVAKESAQ